MRLKPISPLYQLLISQLLPKEFEDSLLSTSQVTLMKKWIDPRGSLLDFSPHFVPIPTTKPPVSSIETISSPLSTTCQLHNSNSNADVNLSLDPFRPFLDPPKPKPQVSTKHPSSQRTGSSHSIGCFGSHISIFSPLICHTLGAALYPFSFPASLHPASCIFPNSPNPSSETKVSRASFLTEFQIPPFIKR